MTVDSQTYQMCIGGEWRGSSDGRTRPVLDPATGEAFAQVPEGTREDAHAALEVAQAAQPGWEQGKPLVEARGEIEGTAGFFEYPTSFARGEVGEIVASDNPNEDIWIRN